ncbi:MAG: dockerin type I repeat-containing protein [Oscillospiraceae bacterium]|nr:dockerin type I repeat-containing protein [Oscillospiraceae bacterium]
MRNRRTLHILAGVLFAASLIPAAMVQAEENIPEQGIVREDRTIEEIRSYYGSHPFRLDYYMHSAYEVPQEVDAPFNTIGRLDADYRQAGLNGVNFCRYIAGLPNEVTENPELTTKAQASAILQYAENELKHHLEAPRDVSDEIYQLGNDANQHCSLMKGPCNFTYSTAFRCMADGSRGNFVTAGHRRNFLAPNLVEIGIGHIGKGNTNRSSQYNHYDNDDRSLVFTGDYIAWPPAYMPHELYYRSEDSNPIYPFSLELGPEYKEPDMNNITIDIESSSGQAIYMQENYIVKDASTGRGTHLSSDQLICDTNMSTDEKGDITECKSPYMVLSTAPDIPFANRTIIFNPLYEGERYPRNEHLTITVKGLEKTDGTEAELQYSVEFFDLMKDVSVLLGDVNCDGSVDIRDAVLLSVYCYYEPWKNKYDDKAGREEWLNPYREYSESVIKNRDANEDGVVETSDIVKIVKIAAHLEPSEMESNTAC